MLTRYYMLAINPEPWAIGSVTIRNTTSGKKSGGISPNPQLVDYQAAVRAELMNSFGASSLTASDIECELHFYFWRRLDTYLTPTGRASVRHVADATNLQKGLEDALQGLLITNDRKVRRITSEIVQQDTDTEPGIIIRVRGPYLPIWQSELPTELIESFHRMRAEAASLDLRNEL